MGEKKNYEEQNQRFFILYNFNSVAIWNSFLSWIYLPD